MNNLGDWSWKIACWRDTLPPNWSFQTFFQIWVEQGKFVPSAQYRSSLNTNSSVSSTLLACCAVSCSFSISPVTWQVKLFSDSLTVTPHQLCSCGNGWEDSNQYFGFKKFSESPEFTFPQGRHTAVSLCPSGCLFTPTPPSPGLCFQSSFL